MANLTERDRGQIILVAAFALAVIFVAMALIVNSAIFTENLASRSETAGSEGALSMRAMVESNVGDTLEAVNRQNDTTPSGLQTGIESGIENVSVQAGRQQALTGRLVNVSFESADDGVRIAQNESGSTTFDLAGDLNYPIAEDIQRVSGHNGTRAFRINASSIGTTSNSSAFEIKVNQSGSTGNENSWRMRVFEETTGGAIHVRTIRTDGTGSRDVEDCVVDRSSTTTGVSIDVTDGTVEGEPCEALRTAPDGQNFHFGAGASSSYNIFFRNADQISGNFSMTLHGSPSVNSIIDSSSQPLRDNALYGVTVHYTYNTSDLRYGTDIRVAPGEPDV